MTEAQSIYGLVIVAIGGIGLLILAIVSGVAAFDASERSGYNLTQKTKIHLGIAVVCTLLLICLLVLGWFCVGYQGEK